MLTVRFPSFAIVINHKCIAIGKHGTAYILTTKVMAFSLYIYSSINTYLVLAIIVIISNGLSISDFLDIEIYSRGNDQPQINNEEFSFIKINGESVISSFVGTGFNGIILDRITGEIINQIQATQDALMANFLSNTSSPDNLVILTVYGSPMQSNNPPINTRIILSSYGCNKGFSMEEGSAFIFIGTPNEDLTYCDVTNKNGSAILQSFQIPFTGLIFKDLHYLITQRKLVWYRN